MVSQLPGVPVTSCCLFEEELWIDLHILASWPSMSIVWVYTQLILSGFSVNINPGYAVSVSLVPIYAIPYSRYCVPFPLVPISFSCLPNTIGRLKWSWKVFGQSLLTTLKQHSMDDVSGSCLRSSVDSGVSCRAQTPKYHRWCVLLRINKGLAGLITVWILIYV